MTTTHTEQDARAMTKPERVAYLKAHGWTRIESHGSQTWVDPTDTHMCTLAVAIRRALNVDMTKTTWATLDVLIASRWDGHPRWRGGHHRTWVIPSPTGGTFTVEITLRPRWCSLAIDRWGTTDRDTAVARPWLERHVWPHVRAAWAERKGGTGSLPSGGPTCSSAHPLDRAGLVDVLAAWVDQELTWGIPPDPHPPPRRRHDPEGDHRAHHT